MGLWHPVLGLAKGTMGEAFSQSIEVPLPGEAGGYEHERHKQNYREMRYAGLLYSNKGRPDIVVHGQLRRFDEGARKGGQRGGSHGNMSDLKMFGNMPGTDCARNVRVPDTFFRTMCNFLPR